MNVSKKNLIAMIVLDVVILLIALGVLAFRYLTLTGIDAPLAAAPKPPAESVKKPEVAGDIEHLIEQRAAQREALRRETAGAQPAAEKQSAPLTDDVRRIGFTFYNSKCKKVEVIGDFNNWMPVLMEKVNAKQWALTVTLAPGEYAYNFVVDGRPIPDPNNPKVCDVGRGFTNSFLKVRSLKEQ